MDPFAAGLDAMFSAPGSAAAVYQPTDGSAPLPIRVIRGQPDELGARGLVNATNVLDLRRSDVANPQNGDIVAIGGEIVDGAVTGGEMFELYGVARLDVEGITWTVGAEPLLD
jgi:hypothetical protein